MQPRRQPSFDPDDEWRPQPLADGRLDPPRRDPPTAVGTATPPPPSRPYRPTRYGRGLTRLERIARICFGGVLAVGGGLAVAITPVGAPMVAGAVLSVCGALVTYRGIRAPSVFRPFRAVRGRPP